MLLSKVLPEVTWLSRNPLALDRRGHVASAPEVYSFVDDIDVHGADCNTDGAGCVVCGNRA